MSQRKGLIGKVRHGIRRRLPRLLPASVDVAKTYERANGHAPDLKNPTGLAEKLCWMKLNYLTDLQIQCVDKVEARAFVEKTVGTEALVPLLHVFDRPEDVRPENISAQSFVVKTTHDSGGVVICWDRDAAEFSWERTRAFLQQRMRQNYYWEAREPAYNAVRPRIIVEELLLPPEGAQLNDYKLWCFGGRVEMIQVAFIQNSFGASGFDSADAGGEAVTHGFFTPDWKNTGRKLKYPLFQGDIDRPKGLEKMIEMAQALSEPFPFCRVDLYELGERIYFGETTFYPLGGCVEFEPKEDELALGNALTLPESVQIARVLRNARGA